MSGYRIARKLAGGDDYEEIASVNGAQTISYELSDNDIADGASYVICSYYEDEDYYEEGAYSETVSLK